MRLTTAIDHREARLKNQLDSVKDASHLGILEIHRPWYAVDKVYARQRTGPLPNPIVV